MDEGGTAPITTSHLKASDVDTVVDQLVVSLISPPQYGYIENVLPSPGFEKSNMGISIGTLTLIFLHHIGETTNNSMWFSVKPPFPSFIFIQRSN